MMLVFLGIGFLSLLTASIASRFVKEERDHEHGTAQRAATDRSSGAGWYSDEFALRPGLREESDPSSGR